MPFSFKPLWHLLVERDLQKEHLKRDLGFSSSTVAKLSKGEYVSLEIIDKICSHFGVQPNEIMEHKAGEQ